MLILLSSLLLFLFIGVPIAYSLGLSALAYFWLAHPELLSILPARLYAGRPDRRPAWCSSRCSPHRCTAS